MRRWEVAMSERDKTAKTRPAIPGDDSPQGVEKTRGLFSADGAPVPGASAEKPGELFNTRPPAAVSVHRRGGRTFAAPLLLELPGLFGESLAPIRQPFFRRASHERDSRLAGVGGPTAAGVVVAVGLLRARGTAAAE